MPGEKLANRGSAVVTQGRRWPRAWVVAFLAVATLGITAGASAPEALVREVIDRLREFREVDEEEIVTAREIITFKLPRQLAD